VGAFLIGFFASLIVILTKTVSHSIEILIFVFHPIKLIAMEEQKDFKPFIAASDFIPEFTLRSIILGAIFGVIFGAASVYLGLKVGLTVSASIPIAVLAISVFKKLGKASILESNIVQTIGSAGESVASGVVFTIPALLFLAGGKDYFHYFQIFVLALAGGILGVLFMIPLRRSLIVKNTANSPIRKAPHVPTYWWREKKAVSSLRRFITG
jgi:OPT oligopeptide transporter protein